MCFQAADDYYYNLMLLLRLFSSLHLLFAPNAIDMQGIDWPERLSGDMMTERRLIENLLLSSVNSMRCSCNSGPATKAKTIKHILYIHSARHRLDDAPFLSPRLGIGMHFSLAPASKILFIVQTCGLGAPFFSEPRLSI